jgi:hypothetical protein
MKGFPDDKLMLCVPSFLVNMFVPEQREVYHKFTKHDGALSANLPGHICLCIFSIYLAHKGRRYRKIIP